MKKVTAAIIIKDEKVLLAQRPLEDSLAGLWEFPGGKIEANESPEECLLRELQEELELPVTIKQYFCNSIYTYPKGQIELLAFICITDQEPKKLHAHSQIKWLSPDEIFTYKLAPADIPIAEKFVAGWTQN